METRSEFSALAVTLPPLRGSLPSVVHRPQTSQRPAGLTAPTRLSAGHHVPIDSGDPGRRIDGRKKECWDDERMRGRNTVVAAEAEKSCADESEGFSIDRMESVAASR